MPKYTGITSFALLFLFIFSGCNVPHIDIWRVIGIYTQIKSFIVRSSLSPTKYFNTKESISCANAIAWGDTAKIGKLIKGGLDVNAYGADSVTFLEWSMIKENKKSYLYLLKKGANPNKPFKRYLSGTPYWYTPLSFSLEFKDDFYLEVALQNNGDPNSLENGGDRHLKQNIGEGDLLFLTIFYHKFSKVKILIKYGADVNLFDACSAPSLEDALDKDEFRIAYLLLKNGANPRVQKNGEHIKESLLRVSEDSFCKYSDPVACAENRNAYPLMLAELKKWGIDVHPTELELQAKGKTLKDINVDSIYKSFEADTIPDNLYNGRGGPTLAEMVGQK